MIKFFQKRIVSIRTAFTLYPKQNIRALEQASQIAIPPSTNIFDTLGKFKINLANLDSLHDFKEIYHDLIKELVDKIDIAADMKPEVARDISTQLTTIIEKHSKSFDLSGIEISLAILYSINLANSHINAKAVSLLENRFLILADNSTLSDSLFAKTFTCLEFFSLNNIKLNHQGYLDNWYKRALDNLKFYSSSQIANLLFISSVQTPHRNDMYNEIKLQLFKNSSIYLKEFVKIKLGLDTNDIKNPGKFVKQAVAKLFLSNYERKGIYWAKDFNFSLSDNLILIRSYNNFNDYDSDFLVYLAESTLENVLESLKEDTLSIQDIQIVALLKEFSEAIKRVQAKEIQFQKLLETLISLVIRVIPKSSVIIMEKLCGALSVIENITHYQSQIQLIKIQICLKLDKEFIKSNFLDLRFHCSLLNILDFVIRSHEKDLEAKISHKGSKIFGEYLGNFDKSSCHLALKESMIFSKSFDLGYNNKNIVGEFNSFIKLVTENRIDEKSITTECGIAIMFACSLFDKNLSPIQIKNIEFCLNHIINNASISDFNQKLLLYFFTTFKNLIQNNIKLAEKSGEYLELLRDTLLRYFADHYQRFDLPIFEAIIKDCVASNIHTITFDDGSNLYNKTLLEEIHDYAQKNYQSFSDDFKALIRELYPPVKET